MTAGREIYCFGSTGADGAADMRALLGGKGAGLAEMARLGVPVPPGFTIPTTACRYYHSHSAQLPPNFENAVRAGILHIESALGRKFGDSQNPLLVSVRSGAAQSMPGMMETILNLGLNSSTTQGLARCTGNSHFAQDSHERLRHMYEKVVQQKLPQDPWEQLWAAIKAVFESWNTKRAIEYRRIYDIPDDGGTAVNIQAMVFGNTGDRSATGVAFTRNPSTGDNEFFGEFLVNAQGEDVVAGIRTPQAIAEMNKVMPKAYAELVDITQRLETHFRDMQDIEFTVEDDKLWMLQTRTGKRTAHAAVRIAVDMADEKLITQQDAVRRVSPENIDRLLHPMLDPAAQKKVLAKGLPASPGAAAGQVVFTSDDAVAWAYDGKSVILVRLETSPDDIQGMHVAQGFLTARGGMTSHAAVVARGMGKPCVVGCTEMTVLEDEKTVKFPNGTALREGDWVTIDGSSGEIMMGKMSLVTPKPDDNFRRIMTWADECRRLKIRANVDTPEDARLARDMGAEGVGLCRTEHMFFAEGRLELMREMIVAGTTGARQKALSQLLPIQREDFKGIFRAMHGLPVTVRLLDPPLHEFLPQEPEQQKELAQKMGVPVKALQQRLVALHEMNPMLGHRGCRLGITYPEIYEMQVRAIMEAACQLQKEEKIKIFPEIELPLIAHVKELEGLRSRVENVCREVMAETGATVTHKIGTMIELPRACITAGDLAQHADFFSFGTNDLTQTTFGLSRDDAGKFLPQYLDQKILTTDPFVSIDVHGVGALMAFAVEHGRKVKPKLEIGICGEHGGDPSSIMFCDKIGLDYVSCSPYRVPVARMAAAHAVLQQTQYASSV
jgi:pyruvate,orthophosphate dikinase